MTLETELRIGINCFGCGLPMSPEDRNARRAFCVACREKWNRMDEED